MFDCNSGKQKRLKRLKRLRINRRECASPSGKNEKGGSEGPAASRDEGRVTTQHEREGCGLSRARKLRCLKTFYNLRKAFKSIIKASKPY